MNYSLFNMNLFAYSCKEEKNNIPSLLKNEELEPLHEQK